MQSSRDWSNIEYAAAKVYRTIFWNRGSNFKPGNPVTRKRSWLAACNWVHTLQSNLPARSWVLCAPAQPDRSSLYGSSPGLHLGVTHKARLEARAAVPAGVYRAHNEGLSVKVKAEVACRPAFDEQLIHSCLHATFPLLILRNSLLAGRVFSVLFLLIIRAPYRPFQINQPTPACFHWWMALLSSVCYSWPDSRGLWSGISE